MDENQGSAEDIVPGSRWLHRNGNEYAVLHISNLPDEERYPKTVVYQNVNNGTVWSRHFSDWLRSFTLAPSQEGAVDSKTVGAEPLIDRLKSSAAAFRAHPIHTADGDRVFLTVQAAELEEAAAELTRLQAEAEAKRGLCERADGMDGAVVSAIRELLNAHEVPKATWVDDHVANAIVQRNQARAEVSRLQEEVGGLRGALESIALRANGEPWPDHFAPEPPDWAQDEYGCAASCGYCGAWMTIVRPGKHQCDNCSDGRDVGALARATLQGQQS